MTSEKILIVDDSEMNRMILRKLLEDEYLTQEVDTAENMFEMVHQFKPDLILLDVMMPGISGLDACRHIRKDAALQYTKIIFVSAKGSVAERLDGYAAGADDYIMKPFDHDELLNKVRIFLRLKSVEELNEIKKNIFRIFTHEILTPLNALLGFAHLLHQKPDAGPEKVAAYSEKIIGRGEELAVLTEKMSLLCRLKEKKDMAVSSCALNVLLSACIAEVVEKSETKKVSIAYACKEDVIIVGDKRLLRLAWQNIFASLVEYASADSVIEVTMYAKDAMARVEIQTDEFDMPSDSIEAIFDEFYVPDIAHHQRLDLNFPIARNIAQLHGGDLVAANTKGFSFVFSIPLLSEKAI